MGKKTGTKNHIGIKLSDLNKVFSSDDVIPIPKGFAKHLNWKLNCHNTSLDDIAKEDNKNNKETGLQFTETSFD